MCGIIGYIGPKPAFPILASGLKRMEYRGYDSYGFCVIKNNREPFLYKRTGKISEAKNEFLGTKITFLTSLPAILFLTLSLFNVNSFASFSEISEPTSILSRTLPFI